MLELLDGGSTDIRIVKWILDTRNLWCLSSTIGAKDGIKEFESVASRALNLLPKIEQTSVLRYHNVKDAKMSLASYLLKHLVISKYLSIPWSDSYLSLELHGKPCFLSGSRNSFIDFNVSHQAGVVSLIASISSKFRVKVGTDIVCTSERRQTDYTDIERDGFFTWISTYEDVLANSELCYLRRGSLNIDDFEVDSKELELTDQVIKVLDECERRNEKISIPILSNQIQSEVCVNSNLIIDAKLRKFYALWCLRESYIKMTGEAFLAPWLKDLEIMQVKAPKPQKHARNLEEGEIISDFMIYLKKTKESSGSRVRNVMIDLTSLGPDFMVAGTVCIPEYQRISNIGLGKWEILDLMKDIIEIAESTIKEFTD